MQRALGAGYVAPSATLRLQNQNGAGCGRVEVLYQGLWGTVCDDDWDMQDAMVACRQLGLDASSFSIRASYGQGVGMVWMDNVECNGTEPGLESCPRNDWGSHDCSHLEDAGVCCKLGATKCRQCQDGDYGTVSGQWREQQVGRTWVQWGRAAGGMQQ